MTMHGSSAVIILGILALTITAASAIVVPEDERADVKGDITARGGQINNAASATNKGRSALASSPLPNPRQPQNPVIGLFTSAAIDCEYAGGHIPKDFPAKACVDGYVLRLLESYGIRVIPIPWNAPEDRLLYLVRRVNGVLFPGGTLRAVPELYTQYIGQAAKVIDYARAHPDFFVFGICQGFEVLSVVMADKNEKIIRAGYVGVSRTMLPLDFTPAGQLPSSVLYGPAHSVYPLSPRSSDDVITLLATQSTTLNLHIAGIPPPAFKSAPLANRVTLLSTNVDDNGVSFGSSWESGEGLNVFAIQFHPERPPYEFRFDAISHDDATLAVTEYFAKFIRERAQRNSQSFEDAAEVERLSVDSVAHRVVQGWGIVFYWLDF